MGSRRVVGFIFDRGRALTEVVPSILVGASFAQNDTSAGRLQGAAPPGRVATVKDLVRFAFCSACQEENLEQFNFCWKCGVQPVRSLPARGIPSGPRSLWVSKKSRRVGTNYWRQWKGARGDYEKVE